VVLSSSIIGYKFGSLLKGIGYGNDIFERLLIAVFIESALNVRPKIMGLKSK